MSDPINLSVATLDRARISRDARFDGRFFIAVITTGIYCRPICPSPSSKKSNVRYYATAAAAAAAGYRPCRRCRPEVAPGSPAWIGPSAVVRRALRLIQEGGLDGTTVDTLAERLGIGARHLDRLFAQHVGVTPVAVAQTRRLHFSKQLLDETSLRITDIAMAAGFGSLRRFNDVFRQSFDCAPRDLRRRRSGAAATRAAEIIELQMPYRPPYDWDQVAAFFSKRAIDSLERIDAHGYTRTVRLQNRPIAISVRPAEVGDALRLTARGAPTSALLELATTAKRVFDVDADPARVAEVLWPDPVLGPWVKKRPGLRVPGVWDPFECAVRAVLGQRTGVETARRLINRVVHRAGDVLPEPLEGLTRLFPTPDAIIDAPLEGIGLNSAKIATLRRVARDVRDHAIDFAASTEEIIRALLAVPGVGTWTAQYVALRALAEPDAFLSGDAIVRRILEGPAGGRSLAPLDARAESWRPWRAYAVIHAWEADALLKAERERPETV